MMRCPECGDVPDETVAGVVRLGVYDGPLYWVHVACGTAWARFTEGRYAEASREAAAAHVR